MSLKDFLDQIDEIKKAPAPFVLAAVFLVTCAIFAVKYLDQAILSAKDATIETLKTQLADYKEKLSGATPDEASKKIRELEARVSLLEPRRLSSDQAAILKRVIKDRSVYNANISIQTDMSCVDCGQYGADFQGIFSGSDWQVLPSKIMGASAASPVGLALLTPDPNNPLPEAKVIKAALEEAKIQFEIKSGVANPFPGQPAMAAILITAKSSI